MSEAAAASTYANGSPSASMPTDRSRHVPGYIYSSPRIYELEKRNVFMKDWLCVARVEEVANPGDYMTFHIVDEPIIVSRDARGELHAFANMCRHRGVEVATGNGNTSEFSCPYHGWLYDLTGKLVGAPYMKEAEGFDPRDCALRPLRADVWAGWGALHSLINLDHFLGVTPVCSSDQAPSNPLIRHGRLSPSIGLLMKRNR